MRFVPVLPAGLLILTTIPVCAQQITVVLPGSPETEKGHANIVTETTQTVFLDEVRGLARGTRIALQDVVLRGAFDPAITGRNGAPVQGVSLEVGKDGDTFGKGKLSWRLDDYDSSVDIILRAPITQSGGVAVTDRGLPSGASATLGYNLTLWGSTVPASVESAIAGRVTGGQSLTPLEVLIAAGLAVEKQDSTRSFADPTFHALETARDAFATRDAKQIAAALRATDSARLNRTLSLRGSYGVGSTTFNFTPTADPIDEISKTKRDTSFELSVAYIQLLRDGAAEAPLMLISAGYTKNDKWKGARSRQVCSPLAGTTSATECRPLVIGEPTPQPAHSIEVDIRSWAYAQKLGINPHFSQDTDTKKWSSELSLSYLVLQKEEAGQLPQLDSKALTVGVRAGSRPQDLGGMYASVFFGAVLSK